MKLSISNIGTFSDTQEIKLDGITVLAGLNGTGKSTVGKILFCIFSAFYQIEDRVRDERSRTIQRLIRSKVMERGHYSPKLSLFIQNISEKLSEKRYNDEGIEEFLTEMNALLEDDFRPEDRKILRERIQEVLSIEDGRIRERILGNQIEAEFGDQVRNNKAIGKEVRAELQIKDKKVSFLCGSEGVHIVDYIPLVKHVLYIDDPNVLDYLESGAFIYQDKTSHRMNLLGKLYSRKNEDFSSVDQILIQEKIKRIERIINTICDGDISNTDKKQIKYLSKDFQDGLNICNMATGLKSFALIKLLLNNGFFEENGTAIFDEPEIHLHPEWQRIWAEIIVLLHKELGMHVLISTHSADFLSFIELFAHKYQVTDKVNLYKMDSLAREIQGDWDEVYRQLGQPFIRATEELDGLNEDK